MGSNWLTYIENAALSIHDTASYSVDLFSVNLPALMFQTGYLTVRDVSKTGERLKLEFPNLDVREALNQELIKVQPVL